MMLFILLISSIQLVGCLVLLKGLTLYARRVINLGTCFNYYILPALALFYTAIAIQYYTTSNNVTLVLLIILIIGLVLAYIYYRLYTKEVEESKNAKKNIKRLKFDYNADSESTESKGSSTDEPTESDTTEPDTTEPDTTEPDTTSTETKDNK